MFHRRRVFIAWLKGCDLFYFFHCFKNGSLVDLQCCVTFKYKACWFSCFLYIYIYIYTHTQMCVNVYMYIYIHIYTFQIHFYYRLSQDFFSFFISWRLITLQYYSGFCHTLTRISHRYTCITHPDPPSHLPLHPIPLGYHKTLSIVLCAIQ